MIDDITENYGTDNDRIKGYGSIVNNEDKDVLADGSTANRLKQGESSLLDKTIYSQLQQGEVVADAVLPVVSAETLESAKTAVVNAIAGLTVKQDTAAPDNTTGGADGESSPNTGDSMTRIFIFASALVVSLGTAFVVLRKREEENC